MADNAARIAELQAQYERLVAERNALGERYTNGDVSLLDRIKELNTEIRAIIIEQEGLTSPTPGPTSPPIVSSIPLPAATPPQDTNTDAETKPFSQTQTTPAATEQPNVGLPVVTEDGATSNLRRNPETGELYDPGGAPSDATAPATPGVGADDDNPQQADAQSSSNSDSNSNSSATGEPGNDSGTGSGKATNTARSTKITPQPNVLDQFASYTWQASIYLMSSEQYTKFITSKGKSLSGYNLLIQNSGAPVGRSGFLGNQQTQNFYENNGVNTSASAVAGRSPAFPLDFYIDNIELKNYIAGKGTNLAHNTATLRFQIIEPNGITLLSRLYQAVQDAAPRNASGPIDYSQAQYLMVLRWYGWDQDGNPQLPANKIATTDPRAAVEKYIPFAISDISFTVSNRLVTYDVVANPIGQIVAGTSRRASIPADLELTGKTVGDVLQGNLATGTNFSPYQATQAEVRSIDNAIAAPVYYENDGTPSSTAAPPTAAAASTVGTMTAVGLAQAMNSLQQELVKKKTYQYADTFEIVFAPGAEAIKNAKVTLKDPSSNQGSTPMGLPMSQSPDSALSSKQSVIYNGRNIGVPAGTSMLYAIDKIIRDSSYIYDQATASSDESDSDAYKMNNSARPVQWYNILMEAIPDGDKYDTIRNAPVYKIRYTISAYTVQNFVSRFFKTVPWLGVHKSYPYWFTGQNIAVLDYQAHFNRMYQLIVSGSVPGNNAQNSILRRQSASMVDQLNWYYAPRSQESTAGAENRGNEIPAEAAEYLYGASALGTAKIKIIGDPAWIQQGSLVGTSTMLDLFASPFLPDGSLNFDGMQPMFEIAWQKPQDYDINTGLADPYAKTDTSRLPKQSFVYTAREVTSEFRGGRFEQTVEGWLYPFPKPDGTNAASKPPGTATQADVRRVDNAIEKAGTRPAPQPGVSSSTGTLPAPNEADSTNASNTSGSENNGTEPADTAVAQNEPEAPTSDGADVEWAGYDPPPKLGGDTGDNTDPPQIMVLEA